MVVILVAHPRKTKEAISNDDVSGSSDITNRVDVVLSYSRNEKKSEDMPDQCDSKLSVLKNRLTGRLTRAGKEIELFYSNMSKRVTSLESPERTYRWEINERSELLNLDEMKLFEAEEWEDLTDEL